MRHLQLAVVQFEQMLDLVRTAVGRQTHFSSPILFQCENVGWRARASCKEPRRGPGMLLAFVAEGEAAVPGFHPDLFKAFQRRAAETCSRVSTFTREGGVAVFAGRKKGVHGRPER